jgi:hypothetical protein
MVQRATAQSKTAPYRSSAKLFCRELAGVSFVALRLLEPRLALRLAATSRFLAKHFDGFCSECHS